MELIEKPKDVNCEIGFFSVLLGKSAASSLKPKQHLLSDYYRELSLHLVGDLSYRDTKMAMERFLHAEKTEEVKVSTLKDRVESEGQKLSEAYVKKATDILKTHEIDVSTGVIETASPLAVSVGNAPLPASLDEKTVRQHITEYNRERDKDTKLKYGMLTSQIEANSDDCCYISIDDVGVRFQKEKRKGDYKKDKKFVENTVVHVQKGDLQYTITAIGMQTAFLQLVAFLLANNLMTGCHLVFLTDGARNIRENIEKYFGFRRYTIILDWFHLKKKCIEYLCMILQGKKTEKDLIKQEFVAVLWTGRFDRIINFVNSINKDKVKNTKMLADLKGYLNRKSPCLACYALRHKLGLRISSNRVEKANDIVVATRQKHNGMSWSKDGSGALAAITVAKINGELDNWITKGEVGFKLVDHKQAA